jgi:hypothetical protein
MIAADRRGRIFSRDPADHIPGDPGGYLSDEYGNIRKGEMKKWEFSFLKY